MLLLCLIAVAVGASSNNCRGSPNNLAFITQAPVLVSTVLNAKLFKVTNIEPNLLVAHVWGKPGKERGRAYGSVLKPFIKTVFSAFFEWADENIESAIYKYVTKDVAKLIA
jgi:hypothetical protein